MSLDVREIAKGALDTVRPDAEKHNLSLQLHGDGPVLMVADRNEIEIIFNNLLSNAVKYNRAGGRVDVHLSGDEQRVTIAVSDTGIGLTPDDAGRLFRDFVRIKNDQTRHITGSGLGLSLVKKLALMYGGNATVTSKPGAGSTFTVTLQKNARPPGEHEPRADN